MADNIETVLKNLETAILDLFRATEEHASGVFKSVTVEDITSDEDAIARVIGEGGVQIPAAILSAPSLVFDTDTLPANGSQVKFQASYLFIGVDGTNTDFATQSAFGFRFLQLFFDSVATKLIPKDAAPTGWKFRELFPTSADPIGQFGQFFGYGIRFTVDVVGPCTSFD